ncbi:outer membrane protein assembly factor [Peteryoungia desertarenae]|uniref:Outer membrane protein assembly factor n=1 Tax=Peteryoungia desertarenae TaxID=1813451 RepID=A0ABX6QJV7_9HYPH|nr:autotransporter assembly complex family protein [Peteryoungia desertarenae]QLF68626.1 outer membrane protein assembly factor [Peteryoungia desertarenae]
MPSKSLSSPDGTSFRRIGTTAFAVCLAFLNPVTTKPASALELFGIELFGSDEPELEVVDPVSFNVSIDVTGASEEIAEKLEQASLLIQEEDEPVSGDLGLVIKARDDRDRLIATLYENARYGGIVTVLIAGRDIDSLPPSPTFDRSEPIPVSINVAPGPLFTLGDISLEGDAASLDASEYGLTTGGEAGSLTIINATDRMVNAVKQQGRPLTTLASRDVVADHATTTVDVTIAIEGGPVAPIGNVTVKGARSVEPAFIERYSRLREGEEYSPQQLRKAAERLRALGVFSSVSIEEAEELGPEGGLPIGIVVSEGKHRYFGVGANYSSIDGLGLEGYWGHRNLFGEAESLRLEGSISGLGEVSDVTDVSDLNYSLGATFIKPGAFFPSATFEARLAGETLNTDHYEADSFLGSASLSYEINDTDTVTGGLSLTYDMIKDAFGENDYLTLGVPLTYTRDSRDNRLNPTEGYRASISTTPSYDVFGSTFFTSVEGSISGYLGLGEEDRLVLAARLDAGSLFGGSDLSAIPATRRFFAGGGGSVRGYSFQEISPYNAAGKATGGRSYVTGSVEARISVTETIGIVPFFDFGTVSADVTPDFSDLRMGAGVGLRYMTPFGPLRLDVAVPLQRYEGGSTYGIYAGIGQSF